MQGGTIVSGDAEGVIKTWDVRKMAELTTTAAAPNSKPVNSVCFDPSGTVLAVTTDAGKVSLIVPRGPLLSASMDNSL